MLVTVKECVSLTDEFRIYVDPNLTLMVIGHNTGCNAIYGSYYSFNPDEPVIGDNVVEMNLTPDTMFLVNSA